LRILGAEPISELDLLAITSDESLRSLRDLDGSHIPLLESIESNCQSVLKEKFDFPKHKIRSFVHYLPTFFQFHVHFTHVDAMHEGFATERARLLPEVIFNLKLDPNYYKKATLPLFIQDSEKLYEKFNIEMPKLLEI
jgi:m7GpppX diphosphatase